MAAYNNYFPATYQPMYTAPQYQVQMPQVGTQMSSPQGSGSTINWVQGEAAARSFGVAPNQSVLLLDSEANVFYIKSADASGMPLPLRIFDYTERSPQPQVVEQTAVASDASSNYITREEFEQRINEILANRTKTTNSRKEKVE